MAATDIRICGRNNSWRGKEYPPQLLVAGAIWILDDVEVFVAYDERSMLTLAKKATWASKSNAKSKTLGYGLLPVPHPLPGLSQPFLFLFGFLLSRIRWWFWLTVGFVFLCFVENLEAISGCGLSCFKIFVLENDLYIFQKWEATRKFFCGYW